MEFLTRKIELCLSCMEYHVVYYVSINGKYCRYCFKADDLLQELTNKMTWKDLICDDDLIADKMNERS